MRIAIISDIHANFPALEETLKSIERAEYRCSLLLRGFGRLQFMAKCGNQ